MVTTTTSKYAKVTQTRGSQALKKRAAKHSTPHDKAFFCPICNKAYSRAHDVKRHLPTHGSGPKKYPCGRDGCDQDFHQKVALLTHWRIVKHDNIKDQVCKLCDAAFSDRSALSRHERTKHGDSKFVCECGAQFTRKDRLMVHYQKIHAPGTIPPSRTVTITKKQSRPRRVPQPRKHNHRQAKGKFIDVNPDRIGTDATPDTANGPARATVAPVPKQPIDTQNTIASPRGQLITRSSHVPRATRSKSTAKNVGAIPNTRSPEERPHQHCDLSTTLPETAGYMMLGPRTSALSFILNQ
ncbi:hypothetical protein SISNIDRAFT_453805 [Sistotremastrum niveocremeum HHB9708]|uniref:C2H2-type domain-containing protein n=2 Tax=Sistotremastraceae TaxID=3402574 RepID=A0A164VET1_9AGAM|nr:hypothetical protein SISNIDRAFT_453805 [Sistotremastrum niveocremeum HHB9708]KZT33471.1 hypothetical protein SISSUDRAFT_1054176 [Sistotremastrum suecicum HHB10207 ss-3]